GLRYSDGSTVTNMDVRPLPAPDEIPNAPLMIPVSVSCDDLERRGELRSWVWPLPPPGPMDFVIQWPSAGIDETSVVIDTKPILDSARRCTRLWPQDG